MNASFIFTEWETISLQVKGSKEVWRANYSFHNEHVGQEAQDWQEHAQSQLQLPGLGECWVIETLLSVMNYCLPLVPMGNILLLI